VIDGQVLSEPDRDALLQWAQQQDHRAGELLLRAGEPGDRIYLVLQGGVAIERQPEAGKSGFNERLGPGELAGVLAFFSGADNQFDIRCVSDSRFACLPKSDFDALLTENPALWRRLQQVGLLRMRTIQLSGHLDRLFGPFGAMMPHILRDIETDIEWLTLKSGQTLFEQGAAGGGAYIVMTGRLQMAIVQPDGREALYGTVVSGETVGEVALLTGQPQAHTVFAARDSELVCLSRRSFELMLQRNTRAIHNVSRILGERLAHGPVERDPSRMPIRCIGLIPATSDVLLGEFANLLEERLRDYGSTLHLSSQMIERELVAPGIAQAAGDEAAGLRLTQWLSDQEERWRYLVYQADVEWSPWGARCARQSDEVVVVADSTAEPSLQEVAARLGGARQRWSLVLLHPPDLDRPHNTSHWLSHTDVAAVFHVRRGQQADLSRLARILTGNAVSLVLGGGGARGFAHLGVLRALEEVGIPVDMVGGTSMGAPIAGFVAQGAHGEELNARAGQAFHNIIDYTLPIVSLISGERISASIKRQTGDWDIEDYWLPFFCVSTNLTTGQPVIHRRGNSWHAVRSSVSIPGVMPPVASDGALLVDGAVLNNLPVDVMREINPFGTVIAVDVTPPSGPTAPPDYAMGLSGWRVLANKLLPWRKSIAVPGIASTILQATVAGSALKRQQMLEQKLADVYININVEGVGALQFDAREQAAQFGYDGAIEPLQGWADENLPRLLGVRGGS
jgi:predicted acylesterase/phospholipase RssA/CRP-like cAMP-binding protein